MADSSGADQPESKSLKAVYSFYSSYLFNVLRQRFPISLFINGSSKAATSKALSLAKRRRKKIGLPLPFPSTASLASTEGSPAIFDALKDIIELLLRNLHSIQENLDFWRRITEGSNGRKAYFMICERGPSAFLDGTIQLIRDSVGEGLNMQKVHLAAYSHISTRISMFSSLRNFLATFLAEIYTELHSLIKDLEKHPENSLSLLLPIISGLFMELQASSIHLHAIHQAVDASISNPLIFTKLPELNVDGSQLTESDTRDIINLIYENLHRLDTYLSTLVSRYQKPGKLTLHWIPYSFGAFGISLGSLWILRHSKLMGSPDLGNWISDAKKSTQSFWNDHVEEPILAIRAELFETFRKRQKGAMEREEVQLTADSLHRMLLTFSEQETGKKFPENTPDLEMLEIVMTRYEKELNSPIKGMVGGELVRGLLIQVQKLKLDIEEAMLELDQILRANEINFAILAALPAFAITFLLGMLVRAFFKQDKRAEGRGRVSRIQRRLLLREIESGITQCKAYRDRGLDSEAQCMYGITLCVLDSLHKAVERHAAATGEWTCLRKDIIELAKPDVSCKQKLHVAARMERIYDCLLPASNRHR